MAYMTLIRFFMKTSGLVQLVPRIKVRGQKHDLDETWWNYLGYTGQADC